jgi:GTPase SAR1 family protein
LDEIKRNAVPTIVILLVGNKCDLETEREVSYEEGEEFAQKNGLIYVEASAKTSQNVEEAFKSSARAIYRLIKKGGVNIEDEVCSSTRLFSYSS